MTPCSVEFSLFPAPSLCWKCCNYHCCQAQEGEHRAGQTVAGLVECWMEGQAEWQPVLVSSEHDSAQLRIVAQQYTTLMAFAPARHKC